MGFEPHHQGRESRVGSRGRPNRALTSLTAFAGLSVIAAFSATACHRTSVSGVFIDTAAVTRQSVVITVSATGTIEPAEVVQVKSKASGQIIKMPVSMGSVVKPGDLIAQIDPRDPQSRYTQAVAALNAAKANVSVTKRQLDRADTLLASRALTAPEHETAVLAYATAQSNLATAQTNLEVAQIALADVTIRAPEAGTIIDRQVSEGQVIASATNSVSGGTTLVTLANLQNIVDSALVTESDIGKVHVGEVTSVTVDAYPNKVFHGVVDKVSPEAVTLQSVTMFPVIIKLDNSAGLLKPGMNSDVSVLVEQRTNALVIPNDAVGTMQDVIEAGTALGVDEAQFAQFTGGAGGTMGGSGERGGRGGRGVRGGRGSRGSRGGGGGQPGMSTRDNAIGGDTNRGVNPTAGVDTARHRHARGVDSAGGILAGVSDTNALAGTPDAGPHSAVVLVIQNGKWTPRRVTLGVGNYDVTEVLSGLEPGDQVALVTEIRIQAERDSSLVRMQNRSGLPGMGGGGNRGRGGGRGGRG